MILSEQRNISTSCARYWHANGFLNQGTPPPILFSELMKAELPVELIDAVNQLLELKMNSPEVRLIPKIPEINEYLDKSILDIKKCSEITRG